ncbi:MAG: IclR family transcriptional regulator [Actinobacteria bacterium]|nr:MAG: IclR family transcriptional regulator [Actinomycetota bacterium]
MFHDMGSMGAESGTQAIERAAQLLVRVVEAPQPPSIGELSARAGLPKSTTSRLVGALERQGLVQRLGARGRLRPGPVLLRYASRDASQALAALAQPSLRRLADESGETINLAVPGPDGVEHLAQEDTAHFVGVTDWVGRRVPFELAANGKCFLAFGGGEVEEGDLIRSRGYATSIDELEVGLSALAAPVLGADGAAVSALSISGPTARLTAERIDELAPLLKDEAATLTRRLRGAA